LVLVVVPLLYPLRLPDEVIAALRSHTKPRWLYHLYVTQLDTFLNYGYSPLPLKEGAFTILVAILVLCWYIRQVGRSVTTPAGRGHGLDWKLYGPIVALLVYGAISLLYTPTFYWSLMTFGLMTAGLLWFVVVYEMPKNERVVRRWFNGILLAGGIVAFFAFLQDVAWARPITNFLFVDIKQITHTDPQLLRLRLGSLIGHNIGVASLISFSWFILLSRLFQPIPWKRKAGWAALLILFFYVIAATQTRGIWVVLAVLTPCYVFWLMRLTGKHLDLKPILAVILMILIILTLQIVPSPRNPFYSPESPLLLRLTHFTPSHLRTETRLRIAVCSESLVASRPIQGRGLGCFQYVFPRAQADYFAAHPDTVLSPTVNRTVQAHSDWLQLIIELGVAGLLIVLAGLYVALRRGWDGWVGLRSPTLRLEMTAALMGVAGTMIHALADFPAHVVSTIATAIFLLAVWASCGRMESWEDGREPAAAESVSLPAAPKPRRQLAAATLVLAVPAAFAAGAWFYSLVQASMYESLGMSYRIYYGDHYNDPDMSDADKRGILGASYAILLKGHQIAPLNAEITYHVGEVATLSGVLAFREAEKAHESPDPAAKQSELIRRSEADLLLRQGIDWLTACQTEIRFHDVFHNLGMAYEHLFRLYGLEEDRQEAKKYYRLAIRYSPCFSRSLYQLFLMLQKDQPANESELRATCRQIARYDPAMFLRQFAQPTFESIVRYDFQQAVSKMDVLLDVQPERPDLWLTKIHLLTCLGRSAEAESLLDEFRRAFPDYKPELLLGYRMEQAAAAGRYEEAVGFANATLAAPRHEGIVPYNYSIRAAALEKLGRPEARTEWEAIEQAAKTDPNYFKAAAEVFLFVVRDPDRAYDFLLRYCASKEANSETFFRLAADAAFKRGDKEKGLKFLERALEIDPKDPLARQLLRTVKP
jgi:tetratricopeptide (TPR) repeat protein